MTTRRIGNAWSCWLLAWVLSRENRSTGKLEKAGPSELFFRGSMDQPAKPDYKKRERIAARVSAAFKAPD
jgi:hypothetical protein